MLGRSGAGRSGPVARGVSCIGGLAVGIASVRLLARDTGSVAIAGHGHGVEGIGPPFSLPQEGYEQTAAGLDGYPYRGQLAVTVLGQQLQQLLVAGQGVVDAEPGNRLPAVVRQGHVMVPFRPVDPAEDGRLAPPFFVSSALVRSPSGSRPSLSLAAHGTSAPRGPRSVLRHLASKASRGSPRSGLASQAPTSTRPFG